MNTYEITAGVLFGVLISLWLLLLIAVAML